MKLRLSSAVAAALILTAGSAISPASAATALVTFDPPATLTGPSIYVAVPGPQTITTAPATFTGGVALGFATFFPAIAFATAPNVYGTANFGNGLSKTLTMDIDPAFTTTEVSFALFNGETFAQSYTVDAYNGTTLVASQTLSNLAANFQSGYGLIDLVNAGGITKVNTYAVGTPGVWDFLIDTVAFNQNITSVVNAPPPPSTTPLPPATPVQAHRHGHRKGETELVEVDFGDDVNDVRGSVTVLNVTPVVPEPSTWVMLALGLGMAGVVIRRRAA